MEYLAIGVAAGLLSGLFGIGGGVVIVPALLLFARMNTETAIGTSLASLLLPVGALGAWHYYSRGYVHIGAALLISLGLFVGAWLGAHLALKLTSLELQRAFAAFLLIIAIHLWWTA